MNVVSAQRGILKKKVLVILKLSIDYSYVLRAERHIAHEFLISSKM